MPKEACCAITYYSDVEAEAVDWLWYPYIPYDECDPSKQGLRYTLTFSCGAPLICVYCLRRSSLSKRSSPCLRFL